MANIGIVTTWFERGAAYVSRAYKNVLEKDHQVYIYARGGEDYAIGDPAWDTHDVTWGPWLGQNTTISMVHFMRWLRKRKIDVVLFNEQNDIRPVIATKKFGYPVGAYVDYYTQESVSDFALYDFLICNTRRHQSVFNGHPCCIYVPWGTDTDIFRPVTLGRLVAPGVVTFFHSAGMGGTNLRKGTDLLVHAFMKVQSPAKLIIHSQASLDHYGANIAELIRKDCRIEFIHRTVGAPGLYHLGDVYVYPTRLEGIGLTICEALAAGLPVITTDSPPMNEFVEDGVTGGLVRVAREKMRKDGYYWPESYVDIDHLGKVLERYAGDHNMVVHQKQSARDYAESARNWFVNAGSLSRTLTATIKGQTLLGSASPLQNAVWVYQHFHNFFMAIVHSRKIDLRGLRLRDQFLF